MRGGRGLLPPTLQALLYSLASALFVEGGDPNTNGPEFYDVLVVGANAAGVITQSSPTRALCIVLVLPPERA